MSGALAARIARAKRIVFFGGAGVSTASGIPDFRGEGGLYGSAAAREFERDFPGLTPEMILSHSFFFLHPAEFYAFYRRFMLHPEARPNAAHRALFRLERAGKLTGLVTQNVDGLHRAAGNRLVYEIHGTVHENRCLDCGRLYGLGWLLGTEGVPRCPDCGGVVKPEVTLYGEPPDPYAMTGACREIARCDLLIVAGTSLSVEPAASCLEYFRGKALAVINREETPADARADLVLRGDVAKTLSAAVEEALGPENENV